MRLIDADKLIFEGQHYNKSQMKAILDFIDAQPTAYDVYKVVEELKEATFYDESGVHTVVGSGRAIEIVKGEQNE